MRFTILTTPLDFRLWHDVHHSHRLRHDETRGRLVFKCQIERKKNLFPIAGVVNIFRHEKLGSQSKTGWCKITGIAGLLNFWSAENVNALPSVLSLAANISAIPIGKPIQ